MLKNRLATVLIWLSAALICAVFVCLLADMLRNGLPRLSWSFLSQAPSDAGRAGGIAPIIVSTGLIVLVAVSAAAPLSLATAILLSEFSSPNSRFCQVIERSLEVLAGVPSIVFGLFGNAFFCIYLGLGFSILSGGLTLACMALPIMINTATVGLRSAPDDYRLCAAALGMSRGAALLHLLLPAAAPAIIAGLMLGIARAGAETAALIFTSGYVDRMPDTLMDSGRALSVHIYDLAMNVAGGDANAYASALVLVVLLLIINSLASSLTQHWLRNRIMTS
ncbi:MAG: phosphate ABC transporter permease PstA [Methylomonas sp.]|jgi:phosphate transport system permease protein|uniref:phosphate ABC transporter permease PstA n=1 Tax=Methylomonas sp. TaxID=418 RepID=UPI0025EB4CFC|nr:phosphate ABC transporter permease PstA [Methylomonas sp.]MCK9608054.1 phosphate ABC transporter permease PstA [Methylomonas sp.]